MKKLIPLFVLALLCDVAFPQDVTLTFTAREGLTDAYVLLSRVEIENVTKGWTETLTFPDTTAFLTVGAGINETGVNNGFFLSQNNPNPFSGITDLDLSVAEVGAVSLELMDANGRSVETWRAASLQPGLHHFRISVANAGVYLLTARQNGQVSAVKMVNNGGSANSIECVGSVALRHTASPTKGAITRAFDLDDVLTYKGFAFVGGEEMESELVAPYQVQSEDVTFTFNISRICPESPTVTDYDGNLYYTVQMGEQCWMRENLRTTHFADGILIDLGSDWSDEESYRFYPDDRHSTVQLYGYLYNWQALMHGASSCDVNPSGVQGICPNGWHVPSEAECLQMLDYVSYHGNFCCNNDGWFIAKSLASKVGWNYCQIPCAPGFISSENNATDFSAMPAGYYCFGPLEFGECSLIWGTTKNPENDSEACYFDVAFDYPNTGHYYYPVQGGLSVRCIKDN